MSTPNTERLFFALWPSAAARRGLVGIARRLPAGRRVRSANLHMTLAFLGDCDAGARVRAITAAQTLAVPPAFTLVLERTALWRRPGVALVAPRETPPELEALVGRLQAALAAHGIPLDKRPFRAHVTLARRASGEMPALRRPIEWPIEEFRLMASRLTAAGPEYRWIARWPLGRGGGVGAGGPL
ncbi:RNA 2',3'-cyclic phosphodiesterase [Arhodomonas sp. SL1]|uniref:RNA 2',3'-cyclic phosphodiesterase n=1 Tax=Arhodomonas sp. SL1 TaxID=3425691 RepID=UPI003F88571F